MPAEPEWVGAGARRLLAETRLLAAQGERYSCFQSLHR